MTTWVIGAGGLLGSAIARRCADHFPAQPVPWDDTDAAVAVLASEAARFAREAGDDPWRIIWAAGAAAVASDTQRTHAELRVFTAVIDAIRARTPRGDGAVFITSSAGGVYAGSTNPPFTTHTTPHPTSPYGELKLAQEQLATERLADTCPVVIGRLSNLYGPGQNLDKLQGIISRLALATVTQQPVNVFVSLDTIRDYIYVDDAAEAVIDATTAAMETATATRSGNAAERRIIASGLPTTIGTLIRTMNEIAKRRVPVALGQHASATRQVHDLRLVPSPGVQATTTLPAGMKAVYLDILERVQQESLRR